MPSESLFKPKPVSGFSHKHLVVIPADVPSRILNRTLKEHAIRSCRVLFGRLFYFERHAVLYGGIGAPALTLVLEPLLVSGAEQILFLGLAGALTPRLLLRSAVVIDSALTEEGTSRHYIPGKKVFSSSPEMSEEMERFLKKKHLPYKRASVVSTDAPYRETEEWISEQSAGGFELVDMEISAVFALSEYYGARAAALTLVSDQLTGKEHKQEFYKLDDTIRSYFFPLIKNNTINQENSHAS